VGCCGGVGGGVAALVYLHTASTEWLVAPAVMEERVMHQMRGGSRLEQYFGAVPSRMILAVPDCTARAAAQQKPYVHTCAPLSCYLLAASELLLLLLMSFSRIHSHPPSDAPPWFPSCALPSAWCCLSSAPRGSELAARRASTTLVTPLLANALRCLHTWIHGWVLAQLLDPLAARVDLLVAPPSGHVCSKHNAGSTPTGHIEQQLLMTFTTKRTYTSLCHESPVAPASPLASPTRTLPPSWVSW
jgi:hypothetical protein